MARRRCRFEMGKQAREYIAGVLSAPAVNERTGVYAVAGNVLLLLPEGDMLDLVQMLQARVEVV